MEQKETDGAFFAPITPAKLGCRGFQRAGVVVQESLNSADNVKLSSANSDGNLLREGDFCSGLGTKTGFADKDSEKSSRIDDSTGAVGEFGEISCMQLLLSQVALANHEVVRPPQTSANSSAEETAVSTHTNSPGVTGSLDSALDLEKQHGRKRKASIDLNKYPRQRMKVKKHRPKILDTSKAKKIPKVKKVRENIGKPPKTPKLNPQAPKPRTPESLPPKLVICEEITSCERGKFTNERQIMHQNFEQARNSCRKKLDFDMANKVEERSDLHGNGEDFDNAAVAKVNDIALANLMFKVESIRKIVDTYERHRCQESENTSIFNLLLVTLELESEIQDFGSCKGMREIINECHRKKLTIDQWDVKALPLLHFPKAFKGRRTRRQRRIVYSKFNETIDLYNSREATTKIRSAARFDLIKNRVFRSSISSSFPPVPRRKRSRPQRRDNVLVSSPPNIERCTSGNDGVPITKGVETCLSSCSSHKDGMDDLHLENQSSEINEAKLSLVEHGVCYQIHKNNLLCDNGLLQLEYQNLVTNEVEQNIPDIEDFGAYDVGVKEWINVMQKLEYSSMTDESMQLVVRDPNADGALVPHTHENWQLVVREQNMNGAIVPHKGRKGNKPKKPTPKVDLDQETMRVWNMLMENGDGDIAQNDDEKEQWWAKERERFHKRVDLFISCMRNFQGNRHFSQWKGSVVDSIIGVFLTQNVSDQLSSSAYMSLVSQFAHDEDKKTPSGQELAGSDNVAEGVTNDSYSKKPYSSQIELQKSQVFVANGEENVVCVTENLALDSVEVKDGRLKSFGIQEFLSCQMDSTKANPSNQRTGGEKDASKVHEDITCDGCTSLTKCQESQEKCEGEDNNVSSNDKHSNSRRGKKTKKDNSTSIKRKGKVDEKKENPIDWDELRRTYSSDRNNVGTCMDSVDWEKVRRASADDIAETIAKRGMHRTLANRIKEFLNRIVKDHEHIDLEWLRNVPPDKAKEYLLSIDGLGLKSVECIRLLALHHHAFPVDTNVGRVAVRLGWVPLQPLPGNLEIHLLNNYPLMDSVQKYLWPRLCKIPQHKLYELHYHMITFGKVFCTKKQPNCKACPLKAECRHYASASARDKLCLPGPQEKNIVGTNALDVIGVDASWHLAESTVLFHKDSCLESIHGTQSYEPRIDHPPSPEPQSRETVENDIEDPYDDVQNLDGEIPTIKLNTEEWRESSSLNSIENTNCLLSSKELVPLAPGATSIPAPMLRSIGQLRTTHHVYVLPDWHPILSQFERREPDDPCPYLFAIQLSDGANQEQHDQRISGTILIPCRTANRGSFPLNGTYYQVNEVFADDESSNDPISVPRDWLWHLEKRFVYCGKATPSICKGMQQWEIESCFSRGFVCVRAFDRKTRKSKPLAAWLHPPGVKEDAKDKDDTVQRKRMTRKKGKTVNREEGNE